jgi:lipid-A-disaccharide synthase-like uncharacterized protein
VKWEPLVAMAALLLLGVWIVWSPSIRYSTRPDATLSRFTIGGAKGEVETVIGPDGRATFRLLFRDGSVVPAEGVLTAEDMERLYGPLVVRSLLRDAGNPLFRALNVTGWGGVVWVGVGFLGQMAFASRWLVQWVASERRRSSVMPVTFWWLSLFSGVVLFAYFAWRQDVVGVIGQTTGVVIYARNIRLQFKQRRREARARPTAEASPATGSHDAAAVPGVVAGGR